MLNLTKTVYVEPLAEYRAWKVISFQVHSAKPQEKEFNTRAEAVNFASKQENKNVLQPLVIGVH
jgi:hypothetical protein